jgi:deazaflavin-dependent oxidoreductase (nitroreductase family)
MLVAVPDRTIEPDATASTKEQVPAMPNPFAQSKTFHKLSHVTYSAAWRIVPTPAGIGLLTTIGRKSGKPRFRAIRAVRSGDSVYAVALLGKQCAWLYNIRANPEVRVKLGTTTYPAIARAITDPDERRRAFEIYHPIAGFYDYVDYANFLWGVPTKNAVLRAHDEWFDRGVPVVFELSDATSR